MTSRVRTVSLVAVAALAVALSLHAATGALLPGERGLAGALQDTLGGRWLEPVADVPALWPVEYAVLAVAAGVALRARNAPLAAAVVLVLAARLLNLPLKALIDRPRPGPDDLVIREPASHGGFPSGHASTAVLIFGYAAVVAVVCLRRPSGALAIAAAAMVIALVGWDRVYDGAHWPSDVLGGYAIGATLLAIAIWIAHLAHRAFSAWRSRGWTIALGRSRLIAWRSRSGQSSRART